MNLQPRAGREPERSRALVDAEYFAGLLARRLEQIERTEPVGHVRSEWQQFAGLVRTGRRFIRQRQLREQAQRRRRAELDARLQESRR